jgi:hypothetical protein
MNVDLLRDVLLSGAFGISRICNREKEMSVPLWALDMLQNRVTLLWALRGRSLLIVRFCRAAVLFTSAAPQPRCEAGGDGSSPSLTACIKIEHLHHHTLKDIPPDCGITTFGRLPPSLVKSWRVTLFCILVLN